MALIGSWWLTALLLCALWASYLVFSFVGNPYPAWVAFLFHAPGGMALLLGLIVNLVGVSARILAARFRSAPLSPDVLRTFDGYAELPVCSDETVRQAAAVIGVPPDLERISGPGILAATGRWSFLPGTAFRTGLVLTLVSLLISAHVRRAEEVVLAEGETRQIAGAVVRLDRIHADLPTDHLQVGEEGTLLLDGISASITVDSRTETVTPGFPTRINGRWYRIRHLGYSQELEVSLRGTRTAAVAMLDLLPPGRSSAVPLAAGNAALLFSLAPDRTITKGLLTGRQYDLAHPSYRVSLQEGRAREDGSGRLLRPGGRAAIGAARLALGTQGLSARIQVVRDPALLPLYAGVLLLLAGLLALLSRFFWYEREVALLLRNGTLHLGARDEFYKKWCVERVQGWTERLGAKNLP